MNRYNKIASKVVQAAQRMYYKGCASVIAEEVVASGKSAGWFVVNKKYGNFLAVYNAAKEAEKTLKKFNIRYVDDGFGEWGYSREGGADFFNTEYFNVNRED